MFKDLLHPVVALVLYIIGNNLAVGCIISTNPQDTVALPNGTAEFNCAVDTEIQGATTFIIFTFKTGITRQSLSLNQGDNGIRWQSMVDETFVTYNIQVNATEENNGLRIRCGFPNCFTEEAQLIIVNGPPLPPAPPSVVLPNLTTMSITWSPPWIYPVDNYTLIIHKGSDDDSIPAILDTVTLATEGYLFHKEQGSDDCDGIYRFSVSADTNVGNTGFSNETIAVFPKDFISIQQLPLTVGMEETTCRSSSFFNISFMRPSVCSFEVLIYEIQVSTLEDNDIHRIIDVTVPDSTEPNGLFYITSTDHRKSIQQFNVTLTVTNQADQSLSTTTIISSSSIQTTSFSDSQDNVQQPRTTVALPGTVVTFTCSDDGQVVVANLEINATRVSFLNQDAIKTDYNDRGISWEEITSGSDTIGFNVSINASIELNGVNIQCFLSPCITDKAYLIVVSAPPDPLDAPTVTPTVSNSLVISWSPPWSHPVNEYTVFIRSNAGITLNNTITDGHSYELMMESTYSTCEDLYFSVEGSTDVGRTGRSNETKLGFIKGVEGIDIAKLQGISRSYNISIYYNGSMELHSITIFVQPLQLDLCSYESIRYTITVVNNRSSDSVTVDTMNISSTTVNLDYTNQHGDPLRVILNMHDDANRNISLSLFQAISLSIDDIIISPIIVTNGSVSPTVTSKGEPIAASGMAVSTIVIIASCGLVLMITALLSVLFGVLYCHLRKRQRATIACRSSGNSVDEGPFTISGTVTSSKNPMYESIRPTIMDLNSQMPLNKNICQQQHIEYEMPIPVNAVNIHLPSLREGTRIPTPSLSFKERRKMDPMPSSHKDEDDYVQMKANPIVNRNTLNNTTVGSANGGQTVFNHSPRYTEPPSLSVSYNAGNNGGEGNGMPEDSVLYAVPGPATRNGFKQ